MTSDNKQLVSSEVGAFFRIHDCMSNIGLVTDTTDPADVAGIVIAVILADTDTLEKHVEKIRGAIHQAAEARRADEYFDNIMSRLSTSLAGGGVVGQSSVFSTPRAGKSMASSIMKQLRRSVPTVSELQIERRTKNAMANDTIIVDYTELLSPYTRLERCKPDDASSDTDV